MIRTTRIFRFVNDAHQPDKKKDNWRRRISKHFKFAAWEEVNENLNASLEFAYLQEVALSLRGIVMGNFLEIFQFRGYYQR